jgi:hypothetical protein
MYAVLVKNGALSIKVCQSRRIMTKHFVYVLKYSIAAHGVLNLNKKRVVYVLKTQFVLCFVVQ